MSWTNKVTWSEGLFLRPQLFQQQERYFEYIAHKRAQPLSPFYWGFADYQIDQESLLLGKLVLASASGLYPDGTFFNFPGQTVPPPPLTLLQEHQGQIIYLALPIRAPNSEETTFEDTPGSSARYSVFEAEVRDANSIGQGPKLIQLSRLRLRLMPEKELNDGWLRLPLARVVTIKSDNSVELDEAFIPPVNQYGASDTLCEWFGRLRGNAQQRAQELADRLSGAGVSGAMQTAEVTDFLLLQILNRYDPLLAHLISVEETSPEQAYLLLRSMASELSTFIRTDTRRPKSMPDYKHADPYETFKALVDDVRELLNAVLIRSAQNIPLTKKAHGLRVASISPNDIQGFTSLVFAVSATIPSDQLALHFPMQSKVGPADRLPEHVRLHLPGVSLTVLPVPPRQIPFNSGFVYFQIEPKGTLWERMRDTGSIALHIASDIPGLRVELWGVR